MPLNCNFEWVKALNVMKLRQQIFPKWHTMEKEAPFSSLITGISALIVGALLARVVLRVLLGPYLK